VKVTGKRRAKLNRHDFTGIFIGYTATDDNIRYIDVDSGIVKTSHHAVFDEAWYLQPERPPMAQLLFEMGMENDSDDCSAPVDPSEQSRNTPAVCPPMPLIHPKRAPSKAKNTPIPLRLSAAPTLNQITPAAAVTTGPYGNTSLEPRMHRLSIIDDMQLDRGETFAQVYLSPSPYCEAFEEELDLRKWNLTDHHTAGLNLIQRDGRLILADILKSTPAARIPKWHTRCRGAWLMEVNGMPVHSTSDVERVLKLSKARKDEYCTIMLSHPEVKDGLTSQGIPQLNIDQFNP
jgi:hypothetical protein